MGLPQVWLPCPGLSVVSFPRWQCLFTRYSENPWWQGLGWAAPGAQEAQGRKGVRWEAGSAPAACPPAWLMGQLADGGTLALGRGDLVLGE